MPLKSGYYKLEGKTVVECTSEQWSDFLNKTDLRRVALTEFSKIGVSTVFLGLDHNFGGVAPQLFETMAFDHDSASLTCNRYATWDEAEAGHNFLVNKIEPIVNGPVENLPIYISEDLDPWLKEILMERLKND